MGYKFLSRYLSIKKVVREWAEAPSDSQKVLLAYALTSPFTDIAEYVKKNYIQKNIIKEIRDETKRQYLEEIDKNSIKAFILKNQLIVLDEILEDK
jgi:Mg/Co/Ni transporter MgtE